MTARQLAARGYVVEPGVPLAAVVEAFVSDLLPGVVIRPKVVGRSRPLRRPRRVQPAR